MSYFVSFAFVIIGIFFGLHAKDINQVTQWIVSALWGGYTAANILKWYWWRFNGYGYFWGMATGIASALILSRFPSLYLWIFPEIVKNLYALYSFPVILVLSILGCILGTFLSKPEAEDVLFYIDPFNKGTVFTRREIELFLRQLKIKADPSYFSPCTNIDLIERVIHNLIFAFHQQGNTEKTEELKDLLTIFKSENEEN